MQSTLNLLRANPGLLVMLALITVASFVFLVLGVAMARSGSSVRPILFVAGFFGIVVGPQLLFHLARAMEWIPRDDLTWVAGARNASAVAGFQLRESALVVRNGAFANTATVFGPDADPDLISDLKARGLGDLFAQAHAAQMAVTRFGGTVTVARFSNNSTAQTVAGAYVQLMSGQSPRPDADGSWTVARSSDVIKVLAVGPALLAWSGATVAVVNQAMATSALIEPVTPAADTGENAKKFWLYRPFTLVAITFVLLIAACTWFFRMATWASAVPAVAGSAAVDEGTLRQRLLAVNALDVPFTVEPQAGDSTVLVATWRYADSKWMNAAKVHGMRRTVRVLMRFDAARRQVRPIDQTAGIDWSAGVDGARFQWRTERGIIFFQRDQSVALGFHIGADGRFVVSPTYQYSFDVRELKTPLITAVTQAGWTWRPTLISGPRWLHWITGG